VPRSRHCRSPANSLHHLFGASEQQLRHRYTERLRCFQVDERVFNATRTIASGLFTTVLVLFFLLVSGVTFSCGDRKYNIIAANQGDVTLCVSCRRCSSLPPLGFRPGGPRLRLPISRLSASGRAA
jgi:hypothetical protein